MPPGNSANPLVEGSSPSPVLCWRNRLKPNRDVMALIFQA